MNVKIVAQHFTDFGKMGSIAPIPYGWAKPLVIFADELAPSLRYRIEDAIMDDFLKRHSIKHYISVLDQVAETKPDILGACDIMQSANWIMVATYGTEQSSGFMFYN